MVVVRVCLACVRACAAPPITMPTWDDFHLRNQGLRTDGPMKITAVYFPLLALVLLGWQRNRDSSLRGSRPVLCLVSGSGQPNQRDHNPMGNNTKGVAFLMERWLKYISPDVQVEQVWSDHGIFRFDSNVEFVNKQLLPIITRELPGLVEHFDTEWEKHFALTLSLADGPQARVFAINAGLRRFRPNYVHLYELKSFWYERILSDQDMDYHAFSKIEAHPAQSLVQLDPNVRLSRRGDLLCAWLIVFPVLLLLSRYDDLWMQWFTSRQIFSRHVEVRSCGSSGFEKPRNLYVSLRVLFARSTSDGALLPLTTRVLRLCVLCAALVYTGALHLDDSKAPFRRADVLARHQHGGVSKDATCMLRV